MASSSTPGGPLPRAPRRRRLVLTACQKGALQAFFQENPYPGITAREHLARELAISESRIQVWVQNQRTRRLRQSSRRAVPGPGSRVPKEGRRKRTSISASQTSILLQAFEEERFPGIGMRESLARKTGIPEARIQVWFQNRRARHPGQSPRPCVPLPPQHQLCADTSSFLQELFSADEMEEDVHPLWVGPLQEDEPPGPLEAPLSEDDFHALLEMLQDSLWPQA
uniref:double homeobox protein 4C-like n=1 Tax=Nyctereutes procyonoides TaxID=34880 RepID=UPI0024445CCD|nr:double homeobox protein 4C-like [Nyctereutes procyonoides]XP_055170324.1 double homeobox protein 4C-like [Nyctereutes procyonoides]